MNLDRLFKRERGNLIVHFFASLRDGNAIGGNALNALKARGVLRQCPDGKWIPDPHILIEFNQRFPRPKP